MHPEIFGLDVFPITLTAASLLGTSIFLALARERSLPVGRLLALQVGICLVAIVGSKLYAMLVSTNSANADALLSMDGFRYPGAIAALVIALPAVRAALPSGLSLMRWADLQVPAICGALVVIRLGCLLEGCCFGIPTELPWGVRFPAGSPAWMAHMSDGVVPIGHAASLAVHPLQVYFLLLNLGIGLWAHARLTAEHGAGQIVLGFLILHEGGKAALELLRDPRIPAVLATEIGVFVLAVVALIAVRRVSAAQRAASPA